jgi:undecaprenyl-diphosphatase
VTSFFVQLCLDLVNPDKIEYVIAALYLLFRNKDLTLALVLFIFTRLFIVILKEIFAIPSPNGSCVRYGFPGYAFPSGHLQISCVFYIWLFFNTQISLIKIAAVMIVIFGAIFEVVAGYHYPIDVVVAPTLAFGQWIFFQKLRCTDEVKFSLIIGLSLFMLALIFIWDMKHYKGNPYTFITLYHVIGLCLGCICTHNPKFRGNILLIPIVVLFGISLIMQSHEQAWINQLKWLFIAWVSPLIRHMIHSRNLTNT